MWYSWDQITEVIIESSREIELEEFAFVRMLSSGVRELQDNAGRLAYQVKAKNPEQAIALLRNADAFDDFWSSGETMH